MSNDVKTFIATRQDGVEVECVEADRYAALEAECERLQASVEALTEQNARLARGARIASMLSEYLDGRMVFTRLAEFNNAISGDQNDC